MDESKRSGQIPAFGNWDFSNELPITQYFECARQAGLVRYSSSSGESDPCVRVDRDLYSLDFQKPVRNSTLTKGTRNRERRCTHPHAHARVNVNVVVKDKENGNASGNMRKLKQAGKVWVVAEQARKPISKQQLHQHNAVPRSSPPRGARLPSRPPKPVDEDLYKIPPELLRTTKRKKMLGFISKCLVPAACVS